MPPRISVFAANWKMNKGVSETLPFVQQLQTLLADTPVGKLYQVVLAPPATHLSTMACAIAKTSFESSAQNCGTAKSGAFTGEISPVVIKDLQAKWVILGHSERRHVYKETDALVLSRMKAALEEGLSVIFCVGELLEERKTGKTFEVVERQLSILKQVSPGHLPQVVVAYEPVWAIGTGETATPQQAQEVHARIRAWVSKNLSSETGEKLRILYGGSVKPENSKDIMAEADVDGLLVGGASLEAATFASVIKNGLLSKI